jgi:macrolide phosphotransferase
VRRTPTALAALASAAVPGIRPIRVESPPDFPHCEYDVAFVEDDRGQRWVVRAPRRTSAALSLEAEAQVLAELRRRLPIAVPQPLGFVSLPEGGRAVIYPFLLGRPMLIEDLEPRTGLAVEIGKVIAAVHEVPPEVLDAAGVPSYSADDYRLRRMAEVDLAARTGYLPSPLLDRWERALEDVRLWRFVSTPTHGDLAAEHVLIERVGGLGPTHTRVSGLIDWGQACIADPADDLAWVTLSPDPGAVDRVLESYAMGRREQPDRYLAERAHLAGELSLVRWLNAGVATDESEVVDEAVHAMQALAQRLRHAAS